MTIAEQPGIVLSDGSKLPADEKLEGAPSVLFDGIALILSAEGASALANRKAAVDFVSDAFAHCKVIGHTVGAASLLKRAGVEKDQFVIELGTSPEALFDKLAARHWEREKNAKEPHN